MGQKLAGATYANIMQTDLFETEYPTERLPIDGSLLDYGLIYSMEESAAVFERLLGEIPWQNDTAFLYGRHITTKRKVAWFGDGDFSYNYSNTSRAALPWTPFLLELKSKMKSVCGYDYNSVLLNLYHDGSEGMGWHSDDEKGLGETPNIASLSFGATRRFDMRNKQSGETVSLPLESGSLIVMKDRSQSCWKHQVPKQLRIKDPRINLTFRNFFG